MASLTSLITNIQTALTASLFASTNCFVALDPRKSLSYPPTDKFCVIQPTRLSTKQRAFPTATAGRVNLVVAQEVVVWLYVRLATDMYNRSDSYLTDATLGALAVTDSVIDTLQTYTATDGVNKWGYELDSVEWQSEERDGTGWGVTMLHYHTDLTGRA